MAARGLLSPDELVERALHERDQVSALWCARQLAAPTGELPVAAGLRLISSSRRAVRAFAVGHVPESVLTRPVLQRLLLDRSGAVRSTARWRYRRLWGDPAPVYRAALHAAGQAYQVAGALSGLNEDHDSSLPAVAVPFLTHPSPAVRCAAVQAISSHATETDMADLLVPMLLDSSAKVAAVTARHLRGRAIPPDVIAALETSVSARARRIALLVRQRQGVWNRVHADLAALDDQDRDLAYAGRTDLLAWLRHGAATSYGRPDPDQAAAIAVLLQTDRLTANQRREIAFVAGIR